MENVVLTIHLIIAACLIGVVLLQRSEGGALGIGGGGGGTVTGRGSATALSKVTWILAAAFIATSLTLTVLAARNASEESVLEQIGRDPAAAETPASEPETPGLALPPPPAADPDAAPTPPATEPGTDAPLAPPPAD